jgi:hypothetical protein
MNLRLDPIQVATGCEDQEGRLVYKDGLLAAVLVCLSDLHGTDAGKWHLEAMFEPIRSASAPIFADLDEAQTWIADQLPGLS